MVGKKWVFHDNLENAELEKAAILKALAAGMMRPAAQEDTPPHKRTVHSSFIMMVVPPLGPPVPVLLPPPILLLFPVPVAPLLPVLGGPAKLFASPVPFSSAGLGDIFIRIDAQMSSGVGGTIFFLPAPFFRGVLFSSIAGKAVPVCLL